MRKNTRIVFAIVISLACYLYFCISSELYLSSDNVMVAVVTNGLFGNNPFCQYLHPLLCAVIRGLASLLPTADMFTVFKDICVFGELALAFYLITAPLENVKRWQVEHYLILAVAVMTDVFLSMGINLWRANYTITTGSFAATGVALLLAGKRYHHRSWSILGAVYTALAFMFRKECGLLAVPFLLLHVVVDMLVAKDRKAELQSVWRCILPTIVIVALLLGSQALFYAREPYATALRYSDNRTVCVDFPMESWENTDYPDRATYMAATNWVFIDTEGLDADTFEAVAKAGSKSQYSLKGQDLRSALFEMRRIAFKTDVYMEVGVVLALFLAVLNVISKSPWKKAESILAIVGAFIILFYFTMRGRAPLRVWQPVLFSTIVIQSLIYVDSWKATTLSTISLLLVGVLLYFSAGQVIAHAKLHAPVTAWTSRVCADDSEYEVTFDGLYIWPNWHATIPNYFGKQNKLPTQRVIEHNIAAGDWTYGQPFYNEFLERIGAPNPARELAEGRACIMEGNEEIAEEYLRGQFGGGLELVETGTIIDERATYKVEGGKK